MKEHRVGFIGLGKLGLPVATAMALKGANVMGYDTCASRMSYDPQPYQEAGPHGSGDFNHWLANYGSPTPAAVQRGGCLRFGSLKEVVEYAHIIFVAVQTPHDTRFEGITPLAADPVDFDYRHLKEAVQSIVDTYLVSTYAGGEDKIIVIISTVLPGTCDREIKPLLKNTTLHVVYNPSFIAMGTTMRDFLDPEFVLLGHDCDGGNTRVQDDLNSSLQRVEALYDALLPNTPRKTMTIPSAELTKIMYNTAISQKIALANTVMELCHKIPGANCDDVTTAMQAANRRVTGPMYMAGGMGDGGGCHPRDNIAMMWLAKQLNLSHDPFTPAMHGREDQTHWLARLVIDEMHTLAQARGYPNYRLIPVTIAGYAYKPNTNITTGSPALLLHDILRRMGCKELRLWDPAVNPKEDKWEDTGEWPAGVVMLGCSGVARSLRAQNLQSGSTVIDPFRQVVPTATVRVVSVGIGLERRAQHDR